jgi:hypothetical protein
MFDFRYHVASLAAVFLALVVGIVIGVGLSGQGVVQESERVRLNDRIAQLQADLAAAETRVQEERAAERFVDAAYPAVMADRLAGKQIVVVFVGQPDSTLRSAISRTIETDANGTIARLRALKVPVDGTGVARTVDSNSELASLVSAGDLRSIGKALARELLAGGDTPLWDALASQLLIERPLNARMPADGVVVVRTADLQQGPSAEFLNGLYSGLSGEVPAVWVDNGKAELGQRRHPNGFAVVRNVDSTLGRVALVVLLETGAQGEYGPGADTVVPPIEPVAAPEQGG